MVKNRDILTWLQRVMRKETRGNVISLNDFNTFLQFAFQKRLGFLLKNLELTGDVTQSLSVFQRTMVINPVNGIDHGYILTDNITDGLEKPLRCIGPNNRKIDWVTQMEYEKRVGCSLTAPTAKNPVYMIENDRIKIYPYVGVESVTLTYISTPPVPYLDWVVRASRTVRYLDEGQVVTLTQGETYPNGVNGATSKTLDMVWSDDDSVAVADMILRNIAPSVADQGAYQLGSEETIKSEQL